MELDLVPFGELDKQAAVLYEKLNSEPDLPCVLMAAAFLDQCLVSLLLGHLVDHQESRSFVEKCTEYASRARLCFALGLISLSLLKNLLLIGKIRNRFAHDYSSLTFDDERVRSWCMSLSLPPLAAEAENGDPPSLSAAWEGFQQPRVRFSLLSVMMVHKLTWLGSKSGHRQEEQYGWR